MDWTPPVPKYSTQEKRSPRSRFGNLLPASLEEQLQLEALGAIESDNNPAAQHQTIRDPASTHAGTSAVGEYGIMPNTARLILKQATKKDTVGPEMANTDRYHVAEDMKHNVALQNELALNELREIEKRSDTEAGLPIGWIQGKNVDSKTGMSLRDREQHPYYKLQHGRDAKYNQSKLEAIKKMFSK